MEGISHEACSLAGTLAARQADRVLRRQRHLDRRRRAGLVHRRHAAALRGLRLARDRRTSTATTSTRSTPRSRPRTPSPTGRRSSAARRSSARARRPRRAPRPRTARRSARRKSRRRARRSAGRIRRSRFPPTIYAGWNARECGALLEADWNAKFAAYRAAHPALAAEFVRRMQRRAAGRLRRRRPSAFVAAQAAKGETVATRKASQQAIEAFAQRLPEMIGGSADLTGSVFTNWSGSKAGRGRRGSGNYVNFGVREFAMSAIANGLALHGGFIPYVGTFLTFSDYARNALRMAALMKLRSIFVFTHDSIGLGEDGPTHQSVEHAASLRLIPGMDVWRPCDTVETAVAWAAAIERAARPDVPPVHAPERARSCRATPRRSPRSRAAATCSPTSTRRRRRARAVIIATGSEVGAGDGRARRARQGRHRRARRVDAVHQRLRPAGRRVSRDACCRAGVPRVAVEAGVTDGWRKYVGAADDPRGARRRHRHVRRVGAGAACCSSISASPSRTSSPRSSACSDRA